MAPEARDAEAAEVCALCADASNSLGGAVIGAPVVDGSLEEFSDYVRKWAKEPAVKGVRQVLHIQPKGTCLRDDVVAKATLCGELPLSLRELRFGTGELGTRVRPAGGWLRSLCTELIAKLLVLV